MLFFRILFFALSMVYYNSKCYKNSQDLLMSKFGKDALIKTTNGMLFTENDLMVFIKIYLILKAQHNLSISQLYHMISQYIVHLNLKNHANLLDNIVVFYILPNTSEIEFLKFVKKKENINGDLKLSVIVRYIEKNFQLKELPITVFKKNMNNIECSALTFIQNGKDLIFISTIKKNEYNSFREDFLLLESILSI